MCAGKGALAGREPRGTYGKQSAAARPDGLGRKRGSSGGGERVRVTGRLAESQHLLPAGAGATGRPLFGCIDLIANVWRVARESVAMMHADMRLLHHSKPKRWLDCRPAAFDPIIGRRLLECRETTDE